MTDLIERLENACSCQRCGESKRPDDFYKDTAKADGLRGSCRVTSDDQPRNARYGTNGTRFQKA